MQFCECSTRVAKKSIITQLSILVISSNYLFLRYSLWETVASSVNAVRVAKKGIVKTNDFRSPQVHLLLGDTSWVEQIDNGIRLVDFVTQHD